MRPDWKYGFAFLFIGATLLCYVPRGNAYVVLLWPAVSFLLVSLAYLSGSPAVFGKRSDGTRKWLSILVLFPYTCFALVVWHLQRLLSKEPAFSVVNQNLIVARRLITSELPDGITLVCDLTSEFTDPPSIRKRPGYRCLPILDAIGIAPHELAPFVDSLSIKEGERLLIHCANGHGRTGMVAAAWLIRIGFAGSVDEAIRLLKSCRPEIGLRPMQRNTLERTIEHFDSTVPPPI